MPKKSSAAEQSSHNSVPNSNIDQDQVSSSSPTESLTVPPAAAKLKYPKPVLLVVGVMVLLSVVGAGAYFMGAGELPWGKVSSQLGKKSTDESSSVQPDQTGDAIVNTILPAQPIITGELRRIDDLDLFTEDDYGFPEGRHTYYEAGNIETGQLTGFTRVIAIRYPPGPGGPESFILATQDFESYILHDPANKAELFAADDWQNPLIVFKPGKIASTQTLPMELSQEITLDNNFSLFYREIVVEYVELEGQDEYGNRLGEFILRDDFSEYQDLDSPRDYLQMKYRRWQPDTFMQSALQTEIYQEIYQIRERYYLGKTEVVVIDSLGVPALYSLTYPSKAQSYQSDLVTYQELWQAHLNEVDRFDRGEITDYPMPPDYLYPPALGFHRTQISTQQSLIFFDEYHTAFPEACVMDLDASLVRIDNDELEQIGTIYGQALYRFQDVSHELNRLSYLSKMSYSLDNLEFYAELNEGEKPLSYEEYIAANPVLLIKDYWQRWVALGEYEIMMPGGCGKPVVYLYPEKPTEVTVSLLNPTRLTTDLPRYSQGWRVMANPNGELRDLQPNLTDCKQIDETKLGFEYAKQACENNSYPYLFWAGNVLGANYPRPEKGWVVAQGELAGFLKARLSEMGLNRNEQQDFLDYWLPQMLQAQAPYYRVGFLQTQELNQLFPMRVEPQPDTVFRVFLDYQPLLAAPSWQLEPQGLERLERTGFTLVEWGGLKQPRSI